MVPGVTVSIDGLAELERKLAALGQDVGANAIVNGAYNANKDLADTMKQNIVSAGAYDTGTLYNSITRKKIVYADDGRVVVLTGVKASAKGQDAHGNIRKPIKYAHLVEKFKPFAADAYEQTKGRTVDSFVQFLQKVVLKHTK